MATGIRLAAVILAALTLVLPGEIPAEPSAPPVPSPLEQTVLERFEDIFTGDLQQIRQRRILRVLISFSKTNFQIVGGRELGFEYELLKDYERYLDRKRPKGALPLELVFIPTPFHRLLPDLNRGLGDIAAAGLTVTPARKKTVHFTKPYLPSVSEVVVLGKTVAGVDSLEALSGRPIMVRRGSSYVGHLENLNRRLQRAGLKPATIQQADETLATEDILEMVNAGAVPITVADAHIAAIWAKVLPEIVVREDLTVHTGGEIAWAVRKNCPELLASLNQYVSTRRKGTLVGNIVFQRYYRNTRWIANPLAEKNRRKLDLFVALFDKYGRKYGFDWLAIAAQAYQESGLDHRKRSRAGAIGIMQIKPSTARDKRVRIQDIHKLENNIHAGVKYMNVLRTVYFDDPAIPPQARVDFSWAAYNAGPGRIAGLRRKAAERGLDPNRWFLNVERVALETIGTETVNYVANINKYYLLYKMHVDNLVRRGETNDHHDRIERVLEEGARPRTPAGNTKRSLKAQTQKTARYHTVRRGETLYGIGRRYGQTADTLRRINGLGARSVIHPGDRLRIAP